MRKYLLNFLFLTVLSGGIYAYAGDDKPPEESPEKFTDKSIPAPQPDLPNEIRVDIDEIQQILEISRRVLPRPAVQKFFKKVFHELLVISPEQQKEFGFESPELKTLSEPQFIFLLLKNPELLPELENYLKAIEDLKEDDPEYASKAKIWEDKFRALIDKNDIVEKFKEFNNPLRPLTIRLPRGGLGFQEQEVLFTHPYYTGEKLDQLKSADNLVERVTKFIRDIKKEAIFSFFDFDLISVADEMVAAVKRGASIQVLVDDKVIEARPEVKAVIDKLEAGGVTIVRTLRKDGSIASGIDSPGLHHHKLGTRDWSSADGESFRLSGNLTQSCLGTEGDLPDIDAKLRPDFSVPNANHGIFTKGRLLALIIQHSLAKLSEMNLRGAQFPLDGALRLIGPAVAGELDPSAIIYTTTPNGALGNVNRNLIARAIRSSEGPIGMMQFAFSSEEVRDALLDWVTSEMKTRGTIDFAIVGDTPFAMQFWSILLDMAGLERVEMEGPKGSVIKKYQEKADNPWKKAMGAKLYKKFRNEMVRIAPAIYGNHKWKDPSGKERDVTAKIHHKVLMFLKAVITGSFNFSAGAETNDEYITIILDKVVAHKFWGALKWLKEKSPRSVYDEAKRRNRLSKPEADDLKDSEDGVARLAAAPDPKSRLAVCNQMMMALGQTSTAP